MTAELSRDEIRSLIRDVPDFPKPGILFKDITPLLAHPQGVRSLAVHLSELVPPNSTRLAAIESRGFILASAMAAISGLGLILLRKPGKLPWKSLSQSYDLEYGSDSLHMHRDSLQESDQVCIVDDILATGGTAAAAEALCLQSGAAVSGHVFLLELGFLSGNAKLKYPCRSFLKV